MSPNVAEPRNTSSSQLMSQDSKGSSPLETFLVGYGNDSGDEGPLWDLITNIKQNFIQVLLIYDTERPDSLL